MDTIRLTINDEPVTVSGLPPTTTLLDYLRLHLHLTGTKEGCAEGDCGACTVAVIDTEALDGPRYRAVNSCLVLLPMVQGKRIYTVESLNRGAPHPAQEALVTKLGSQCGYCTPGVVMSMFEACYRDDLDEPWKLDDQMCGNLCRCTGYRPIREATRAIAGIQPDDHFASALREATADPPAPAFRHGSQRFFAPSTFAELFDVLEQNQDARIVCGGTDVSLEVTKRHVQLPCLVSVEAIDELRAIQRIENGWRIGATVTLSDLESWACDELPPITRMLRFFGSRQIKHRATLGGNLCNASPIGDMAPILLALDASAVVRSRAGVRRVALDRFFVGYRKTACESREILEAVEVPSIPDDARVGAYKVSKRRELDISGIAAGMMVRLSSTQVVNEARLAFGGMAATPARATRAERVLVGEPWTEASAEAAARELANDFTPIDDHRASAWYRATVAQNLIRGFFLETERDPVPRLSDRPTATVEVVS